MVAAAAGGRASADGGAASLLPRGLDAIKGCERVYLEAYTSMLLVGKEKLVRERKRARRRGCPLPRLAPTPSPSLSQEALYGKEVVIADRGMVESVRVGEGGG